MPGGWPLAPVIGPPIRNPGLASLGRLRFISRSCMAGRIEQRPVNKKYNNKVIIRRLTRLSSVC